MTVLSSDNKINVNSYKELKDRQGREYEELTENKIFWAFGREQFDRLLNKLNLTEEQFCEQFSKYYGGGFIRKSAIAEVKALSEKHYKEIQDMKNNFQFLYDGLYYEMSNHEMFYSMDYEQALSYLGFSVRDTQSNKTLLDAFQKARHDYHEWCLEHCC